MKRSRSVETSYFEMLDWYFKKQSATRISPIAQAVMSHILWQCNLNYGDSFEMNEKVLAVMANVDVRTLRSKLKELSESDYINVAKLQQECYKIAAKLPQKCSDVTKFEQECSKDAARMSQTCTESQGVARFLATNKNKINKENKKKNYYEIDLESEM